jgi:tetratricopeptide (TPR) repeat protein
MVAASAVLLFVEPASSGMAAPAEAAWWMRLWEAYVFPVPTTFFWILALVGLAILWRLCVRWFPRKATLVAFEDLSVPRAERGDASRVLTRMLVNHLHNPKPVQMFDLHMDIMPGIDEAGFGGLQPDYEIEMVRGFEPSDRPVKVGGVELTLRDVFVLASRLFCRPYKAYLTGWLKQSENGAIAFASFNCPRHSKKDRAWRLQRTGPRARETAVADLAAMIMVDTRHSTLTKSWQSFRNFHKAVKLRQDPGMTRQQGTLTSARTHLERAVTYDPANWVARFNLALTLCRDRQARTALKHFEMLEEVIHRDWPLCPTSPAGSGKPPAVASSPLDPDQPAFQDVVWHLTHYPECAFLIIYNKSISLTRLGHAEAHAQADKNLGLIAGLREKDGWRAFSWPYNEIGATLKDRSRIELSLYALSAQAGLLSPGHSGAASRCDRARLEQLLRTIEELCAKEQKEHWRSLQTTRAVALTALASALMSEGNIDGAHDRLQSALAAEPQFIEAHLLLAGLYIEYQDQSVDDWASRARALLHRALVLYPNCRRAVELLEAVTPCGDVAPEALSAKPAAVDGQEVAVHVVGG